MINRPEAVPDIGLQHPLPPLVRSHAHCLARVDRGPLGPEPVTRVGEPGLEDRFEDQLRGRHHHPIRHGGNRERPEFSRPPRLGDLDPPQRRWTIRMRPQPLRQVLEEHFHPGGGHHVDGQAVHARRAPVRTHDRPCPPQDVHAVDVAIQGMEPSFGFLLGTTVERPLQGSDLVQRPATRSCGAFLPADGSSRFGTHPGTSLFVSRIDEAGALRS